jgi:Fatty acid hydroxylase superfamily
VTVGPSNVARIRLQLRAKLPEKKLSGRVYFALLNFYLLSGIALCLFLTSEISWQESLTVPATFLYANLAEYWAHRGPMHRPVPLLNLIFRGHTLQHHLFFTHDSMECDERADFRFLLLPPYMVLFFTFVFIVPLGIALYFIFSANVAYLYAATAAAYYLNYEAMHALYHLPESHWLTRVPLVRALRISHRRHHDHRFMTHCNFNITYPIGDVLFGTRYSPSRALKGGAS